MLWNKKKLFLNVLSFNDSHLLQWYCFCKGRGVSVPEIQTFVIFSIQLSRVQSVSHLSSNIPNLWCVSILHLKLICSTIYEQTKSIYVFLEFLINILYQAQFYLTSFKLDKPNFYFQIWRLSKLRPKIMLSKSQTKLIRKFVKSQRIVKFGFEIGSRVQTV